MKRAIFLAVFVLLGAGRAGAQTDVCLVPAEQVLLPGCCRCWNPDSTLIDTCKSSPTFDSTFSRRSWGIIFDYQMIRLDSVRGDSVLFVDWKKIDTAYAMTREGFRRLDSIYGGVKLRKGFPDVVDTTFIVSRQYELYTDNYEPSGAVLRDLQGIPNLEANWSGNPSFDLTIPYFYVIGDKVVEANIGDTLVMSFIALANPNSCAITVDYLGLSNCPSFSLSSSKANVVPFSIPSGTLHLLEILFHPTQVDSISCTLAVSTHEAGSHAVLLAGKGIFPAADFTATGASFDDVMVGNSKMSTDVMLHNRSPYSGLMVTHISFDSAQFSLEPGIPSQLPFGISPGKDHSLSIQFTPNHSGPISTLVRIESNEAGSRSVAIDGNGLPSNAVVGAALDVPYSIVISRGTKEININLAYDKVDRYRLYDVTGRLMRDGPIVARTRIASEGLCDGVYFLRVDHNPPTQLILGP